MEPETHITTETEIANYEAEAKKFEPVQTYLNPTQTEWVDEDDMRTCIIADDCTILEREYCSSAADDKLSEFLAGLRDATKPTGPLTVTLRPNGAGWAIGIKVRSSYSKLRIDKNGIPTW